MRGACSVLSGERIVLMWYVTTMRAGQVVLNARRSLGLTQAELARRSATTQNYVSRIERGAVEPTLPTIERLLYAMGLRLELGVVELPPGNEDPAQLRADYAESTPEERVGQAMMLSEFLTGVAADAASGGSTGGAR